MRATTLIAVAAATMGLIVGLVSCGGDDDGDKNGGTDTGGGGSDPGAGGGAGGTNAGGENAGGSGSTTGGGGSEQQPETCTAVTVGVPSITDYDISDPSFPYVLYMGQLGENIDGDGKDVGQFENYIRLTTGTFDLASSKNSNYKTCEHCVRVFTNVDKEQSKRKIFFQTEGSINVEKHEDGWIKATISNVKLVEVNIGNDFTSTPVLNGDCLTISSWTFDKSPPVAGWLAYCDGRYETGKCDCGCGAWDPDCTDPLKNVPGQVDGCSNIPDSTGPVCAMDGTEVVCEGGLLWTCPSSWYTDNDCDCQCGSMDPTCLDSYERLFCHPVDQAIIDGSMICVEDGATGTTLCVDD